MKRTISQFTIEQIEAMTPEQLRAATFDEENFHTVEWFVIVDGDWKEVSDFRAHVNSGRVSIPLSAVS